MLDSETFWLTVTHVALGVGVGLCVLITAIGIGRDILVRRKHCRFRHEIDSKT